MSNQTFKTTEQVTGTSPTRFFYQFSGTENKNVHTAVSAKFVRIYKIVVSTRDARDFVFTTGVNTFLNLAMSAYSSIFLDFSDNPLDLDVNSDFDIDTQNGVENGYVTVLYSVEDE